MLGNFYTDLAAANAATAEAEKATKVNAVPKIDMTKPVYDGVEAVRHLHSQKETTSEDSGMNGPHGHSSSPSKPSITGLYSAKNDNTKTFDSPPSMHV